MNLRLLAVVVAMLAAVGCARERERPEAAGAVFAPDPVTWEQYDVWRKEIVLAVDPNCRDDYPGAPFITQEQLLRELDAIDVERQAHHWTEAHVRITALSDRLRRERQALAHCMTAVPVAQQGTQP